MPRIKYPQYLEKGMKFGRLTIVGVDESSKIDKFGGSVKKSQWKYFCQCNCGNNLLVIATQNNLTRGHTKSCGCLKKEVVKNNFHKTNIIEDYGDYIKIFFFNKNSIYFVVDKDKYHLFENKCWYYYKDPIKNTGYAKTNISIEEKGRYPGQTITAHNLLLPVINENGCLLIVDHIDGDGLNNRMENLRYVTYSQNAMNSAIPKNNTSMYKGVSWDKHKSRWNAYLSVGRKKVFNRYFRNLDDAIKARKEAEDKYHGEYSLDNSRGYNNRELQ